MVVSAHKAGVTTSVRNRSVGPTLVFGLHQAYRAMEWLGEPFPRGEQAHATPFAPRCVKDVIEETLFHCRARAFG